MSIYKPEQNSSNARPDWFEQLQSEQTEIRIEVLHLVMEEGLELGNEASEIRVLLDLLTRQDLYQGRQDVNQGIEENVNRPLSKLAAGMEFEGGSERRTAAYYMYVRIRAPNRRTNYQQQ